MLDVLDGSFHPLLSPTPHRPVSIATKHLRLTKTEYIGYKWDSIKHQWWRRVGRHSDVLNLPNIASIIFIVFVLKTTFKGEENSLVDWNLAKAERSLSSLKEMDYRMNMIADQQERIRQFADQEIRSLRTQLEDSVKALKQDFFDDMKKIKDLAETSDADKQAEFLSLVNRLETNFTAKLQTLYTELSNISAVVNRTKKVVFKNIVTHNESLERLERNLTIRMEDLVKIRTNTPPAYAGVNLASRKLGARNIADLSSSTYSYESYLNRLSAFFYNQDLLDWPLMDRATVNPGEAFCFNGNSGDYTVQLASVRNIKSVMYEHDYWPYLVPLSAPKDYQIWTCKNGCESLQSYSLAANCLYSSQGGSAQVCEVTAENTEVHSIRMRILSNYGQKYTCMYVLRVFAD